MNKLTKKIFLLILFIISTYSINAQLEVHLISGEAWAKGDFVEIGINSRGVYGAQTANKPASFHNNRESDGNNIFGFIANPLGDGWVDYDGDYFTPGSPEEGFSIEINGINYNNNNSGNLFQIPGEIKEANVISSDCFEDTAQIYWEGNIEGVNIKRYYSITKEGLFIQMTTLIKNLSSEAKNNVYWMHNVDPDNNVTLSGNYATNMELISQASSTVDDVCLVKASQGALGTAQDMDGSHVSLYAKDENARVSYGGFDNRTASAVWNGTGAGLIDTEGASTSNVDEAISLGYLIGTLEINETVQFTYYYILEDVDESFIPFIVNAFQESPTTYLGTDGVITLTGLTAGESYIISYLDDGVLIPDTVYVADANGDIFITGLNSGIYSNFTISFSGCATSIDSVFTLTDPPLPDYTISTEDFTNCDAVDGKLIFSGLTPNTIYTVTYSHLGTIYGPVDLEADINGEIIFTDLAGGVYTNFAVEQYEGVTLSAEEVEIFGPLTPTSYPIPNQFYCDDDYDYITTVDLNLLNDFIIGPDMASIFQITYHASEQDVIDDVNLAAGSYNTIGETTYTLYAKKTEIASGCYSYVPFNITINLPPVFDIYDDYLCLNSDDSINTEYELPVLDTELSEAIHSFEWFLEGVLIPGENSSQLTADVQGNYSVTASIIATTCSYTQDAIIYPSGPPQVLDLEVITDPFSENHTVEITASGYGNYAYAVNNGPWQDSPSFTNLPYGINEFQIIDTNGCGIVKVEKLLIDYMKFFTPNNDGVKDYWQIVGINGLIQPEIFIFDRHGKLLKQLSPSSRGWDGTFNNQQLPPSDYWFRLTFKDNQDKPHEFMEHFTLKR